MNDDYLVVKVSAICQSPRHDDRFNRELTRFIEEEGILVLLHVLRRSRLIQEQRVNSLDILHLNLCPLRKKNMS